MPSVDAIENSGGFYGTLDHHLRAAISVSGVDNGKAQGMACGRTTPTDMPLSGRTTAMLDSYIQSDMLY